MIERCSGGGILERSRHRNHPLKCCAKRVRNVSGVRENDERCLSDLKAMTIDMTNHVANHMTNHVTNYVTNYMTIHVTKCRQIIKVDTT